MAKQIVLASGSIYKRRLLTRLHLEFDAVSPGIYEVLKDGESPEETVLRLSVEKAEALIEKYPHAIIIGSDQAVSIDGDVLGKPITFEKAKMQLLKLQGRTHKLLTAVTLISKDRRESALEIHEMTMKPLTIEAIARYLVRDQPLDSAGAYKIETLGISLFEAISGNDPVAIMGLPMIALIKLLQKWGIDVP
jgi:7-methyl-GTP pyrophosphatase